MFRRRDSQQQQPPLPAAETVEALMVRGGGTGAMEYIPLIVEKNGPERTIVRALKARLLDEAAHVPPPPPSFEPVRPEWLYGPHTSRKRKNPEVLLAFEKSTVGLYAFALHPELGAKIELAVTEDSESWAYMNRFLDEPNWEDGMANVYKRARASGVTEHNRVALALINLLGLESTHLEALNNAKEKLYGHVIFIPDHGAHTTITPHWRQLFAQFHRQALAMVQQQQQQEDR